jgi:hypothetical protein
VSRNFKFFDLAVQRREADVEEPSGLLAALV